MPGSSINQPLQNYEATLGLMKWGGVYPESSDKITNTLNNGSVSYGPYCTTVCTNKTKPIHVLHTHFSSFLDQVRSYNRSL